MNITNSDAVDGSEAQILVSGRRRSCFQVIYKNNLMLFQYWLTLSKSSVAWSGYPNLEYRNYWTVDFCLRFSCMCSILMCWLYFWGAIWLICLCQNGGRVSGQKQKLFSPLLFMQILRKKLYCTDHWQGRLFTCLQTKKRAELRCKEDQVARKICVLS